MGTVKIHSNLKKYHMLMVVHVDPSYCIQVLIINDKLPPNGQNDPWSCNAWAITNSLSIQLCTPGNQTWQWEILQKKGFNGKISYKLVNFPLPCLKKIEYQRVTTETWSRRSIMMYSVTFSKLEISKFANDSPLKTASCSLQHLALCCWPVRYITQLSFKNDQQVISFPNLPL